MQIDSCQSKSCQSSDGGVRGKRGAPAAICWARYDGVAKERQKSVKKQKERGSRYAEGGECKGVKGVISVSAAGVALQSWLSARRANLSQRCQLDWSGEVSTLVNLSGSRLFKNYFIEQQTHYNCVCKCVCVCASQTTWTHLAQKDVEQLLLPSFPCSSHALDNFRSRVLVPHNLYSLLAVALPLPLSLCVCVFVCVLPVIKFAATNLWSNKVYTSFWLAL